MRKTVFCLCITAAMGCTPSANINDVASQLNASEEKEQSRYPMRDLAKHYYEGDGKGDNLDLYLDERGDFIATHHGCAGPVARHEGKWQVIQDKVVFSSPIKEGMVELTVAKVIDFRGARTLLREQNQPYVEEFGELFTLYLRLV